ncbi:hypothetical protein [Sphingobacterium lumbrici]|uniref:hypothetical protein n=1 Tax=Sphingobacterium lumbrici TaxID=2559600 RepID=UPI001F48489C|nr:hypothetical protein [Sphingobacterium lumbrici]
MHRYFLHTTGQYDKQAQIPIESIEAFINKKVVNEQISSSCQQSLVGAIKKLYLLQLDQSLRLDYLLPKRSETSYLNSSPKKRCDVY